MEMIHDLGWVQGLENREEELLTLQLASLPEGSQSPTRTMKLWKLIRDVLFLFIGHRQTML